MLIIYVEHLINLRKKININGDIQSLSQTTLKQVEEFNYLGSNIASFEKDVKVRIAKGWAALGKLVTIWKKISQKKRNEISSLSQSNQC